MMIKYIKAKKLTNIAMVNGNENIYKTIVDDGQVKQWIGFGWIKLHEATSKDLEKYPVVERT
jgi:hypothetical protein